MTLFCEVLTFLRPLATTSKESPKLHRLELILQRRLRKWSPHFRRGHGDVALRFGITAVPSKNREYQSTVPSERDLNVGLSSFVQYLPSSDFGLACPVSETCSAKDTLSHVTGSAVVTAYNQTVAAYFVLDVSSPTTRPARGVDPRRDDLLG